MLDPAGPLTPAILWLALVALLALLVVRTVRKDRREYQRFKRYRTTARRQKMFAKWLRESFLFVGEISLAILLLAATFVTPFLDAATSWGFIAGIRALIAANPGVVAAVIVGATVAVAVLTAVGIRVTGRRCGWAPSSRLTPSLSKNCCFASPCPRCCTASQAAPRSRSSAAFCCSGFCTPTRARREWSAAP